MLKRKKTNEKNLKEKKKKPKIKKFIEIPEQLDKEELDDQEIQFNQETINFINGLDKKGITRSSKDQKIENRKNRPKQSSSSKFYNSLPKIPNQNHDEDENLEQLDSDDLALGSGSDDDLDLLSDMPSSNSDQSEFSDIESEDDQSYSSEDSALEQAYYAKRTNKNSSDQSSINEPTETKLPILHPNGIIQRFPKPPTGENSRVVKIKNSSHSDNHIQEKTKGDNPKKSKVYSDPSLGSRFGRQPLAKILSPNLNLKTRIQYAKLEIATLAQDAIADPEMSLGSIKRIFALSSPTLNHPLENALDSKINIDQPIRMMAILSLLAIFLDIIPGYRIRPITDIEKSAKVSQMIARQREWEEGLVNIYKRYLELCEKEIVQNSVLSTCCLKSLCKLSVAKTHFNFTKNITEILVRKLGQKEWDENSEECAESIVSIFKNDIKGDDSLQLVRLIVKTIKSKNYSVHPELLQVLLSLRLRNELSTNIRASTDKVYSSNKDSSNQKTGKLPWKDRAFTNKSSSESVKISKKARKVMKARAGVEAEIAEAEESVKVEEKERNQTETLKMIFGCYFRIIKLPYRTNLLPIALESLSRFAHLVNIDFFRDLLEVLKGHINQTIQLEPENDACSSIKLEINIPIDQKKLNSHELNHRLYCILTAFELLSGQGEALNLDLTDIINSFYNLLLEVCNLIKLEEEEEDNNNDLVQKKKKKRNQISTSEIIMKILEHIFFKQGDKPTPQRCHLFSKRILTVCLTITEPKLVIKLLNFIIKLTSRQASIQNQFSIFRTKNPRNQESKLNQHHRLDNFDYGDLTLDELDSDQVAWELGILKFHWHHSVRTEVLKLISS